MKLHRKIQKVVVLRCPVCQRSHVEHPEFGNFCCASCLQTVIRPLMVTMLEERDHHD
jgi:protein-arginine kinase activator protein McsA